MNEAMTHGNMIIFLLLAFSVAKVWAVTGVGCQGGWINFTCENPDNTILPMSRTRIIKNTVVVENLQQDDNGALCLTPNRIEFRIMNCRKPEINRTVYNKAQATIKCSRPDSSDKFGKVYLCKETGDSGCKDVSSLNTYGKYIMSPHEHGLYVTIKNIRPEDQGIYWCVEDKDLYDRSFRKYNITVRSDFSDHHEYGDFGENIVLTCDEYPKGDQENKFFCKGEDPQTCDHLGQDLYPEKFTQFENSDDRINVTIFDITAEDGGTYWFGSENVTEHRKELEIFCRLKLTVGLVLHLPPLVWAVTGVGCQGGWINFTCENPDNNILPMSRTRIINNTVVVENLQQDDNGALCLTPNRIEFRIENCKPEINRTVYNKAQTLINCGHHDSYKIRKVYLCKETGDSGCKDVSLLNTHGKYIMSPHEHGLYVTINYIRPEDQGIYWCVEDKDLYDRSFRKYNITVRSDFSDHHEYGRIGENIVLTCDEYPKGDQENKFFCKGQDPQTCDHLGQDRFPKKFTQFENSDDRIKVTIFDITEEDGGTYWFGSGNVTEHRNELEIFCRLKLTVGLELADLPLAAPYLSIVTLCVVVAVVVLLVVFVLIKNVKRRNEAPRQNNRQEERVYEELQMPDRCEYGNLFNKREDDGTVHTAPPGDAVYATVDTNEYCNE